MPRERSAHGHQPQYGGVSVCRDPGRSTGAGNGHRQAITLVTEGDRNPFAAFMGPSESGQELQFSDDGRQFRSVIKIPGGGAPQHILAFPAVTARFFHVSFTAPPPAANPFGGEEPGGFRPPRPPVETRIAELVLHTGARVNRFEEKAAFAALPDLYAFATPPVTDEAVIRKADVLDLTLNSTNITPTSVNPPRSPTFMGRTWWRPNP